MENQEASRSPLSMEREEVKQGGVIKARRINHSVFSFSHFVEHLLFVPTLLNCAWRVLVPVETSRLVKCQFYRLIDGQQFTNKQKLQKLPTVKYFYFSIIAI